MQGPSGIFIFLGNEIPAGKSIGSYKIERTEDNKKWQPIAEISTPLSFDLFAKAVENAKSFFPSQPLPQADKLKQIYQKAVAAGNSDSMKGMRLLHPLRVALGIMYYDTSASKHIAYRYRVTAVKPWGIADQSYLTDTVSLPYLPGFDTITFSESSYNINSVRITWKSAGPNPAPLFMVFKFRFGAPVPARGSTSRYVMNDTTYFTYYDTTVAKEAGKEMQFFVSPFDQFGNSGLSSQVAVITQDNFNKATFVKNHIAFEPKLSGVQICWHFTDPVTVKQIEIFRSESDKTGFGKLAEVPVTDTSYLDQRIWPEKKYYYYVQAVAKAGKRTKQSKVMAAEVPGLGIKVKLKAPVLRQVAVVNNAVRLLIEVNDTTAKNIRIFRGKKGGLVTLPDLVKTEKEGYVEFIDLSLTPEKRKGVFYAVRNENTGEGISALSQELPIDSIAKPDEVSYFYAFSSKGKIKLYWDDVAGRSSKYIAYSIARQHGAANSKSPLMVLSDKLALCSYSDEQVQDGNQYTYVLSLVDRAGNTSEKTYKATVQLSQ